MNTLAQIDALIASLPDDVRSVFAGRKYRSVTLRSGFDHYGEGATLQEAYNRAHAAKAAAERRSPEAAEREIASWTLADAVREVAK